MQFSQQANWFSQYVYAYILGNCLAVCIPTPGKLIILLAQTEDLRSLRINIVELVTGLVAFSYFGQQSAHNITNKYSAS